MGGERDFEGGQLITLWLTAIHCKNLPGPKEHASKTLGPSPPVFASSWPEARWNLPILPINQLSERAHLNCLSAPVWVDLKPPGRKRNPLCSTQQAAWHTKTGPTQRRLTWNGVTLHQKSIYSWFFTLPQQCRQCCTVCTCHFSEHFDTPGCNIHSKACFPCREITIRRQLINKV